MLGCLAKPIAVGLHLFSAHGNHGKDYNDINPGAWVEKCNVRVGAYYNSFERLSAYALYRQPLFSIGPVKFNAIGGLITGYSQKIGPFKPGAGLLVKIHNMEITYLPRVRGVTRVHVLSVGYKF